MKNHIGRPTLYKPEHCLALVNYFSAPPYVEKTKKIVTKTGDIIEVTEKEATDFPTLAGFAIELGVNKDTLNEWCKRHPEFSEAYKLAKLYQERYLAVNGNKDLLSTAFAIFTAKNVIGWRDKQPDEVDVVVNNFAALSDADLDQKIKEKFNKVYGEGEE
jgi:DNA-packaging protein gp3